MALWPLLTEASRPGGHARDSPPREWGVSKDAVLMSLGRRRLSACWWRLQRARRGGETHTKGKEAHDVDAEGGGGVRGRLWRWLEEALDVGALVGSEYIRKRVGVMEDEASWLKENMLSMYVFM